MRRGVAISASALLGFAVSALLLPAWTDNVESAQVVSGIVSLPADNPMRLYHLSVASVLIDGAALLLKAGASEWTLSVLSCGLQGAVSFAAVTACTLALSAGPAAGLLVPLLLLRLELGVMTALSRGLNFWPPDYLRPFHGHAYPVIFPDHQSIYGVIGLFGVLLVWGLFALRRHRAAALLAGLFPWFHVTLAAASWIGSVAGLAAWRSTELRNSRTRATVARWFLAGLAAALAGLVAHRALVTPAMPADPAAAGRLVTGFIGNWDDHVLARPGQFLLLLEVDAYVAVLLVLLAVRGRWLMTPAVRFLVASVTAVTAAGVALGVAALLPASPPLPLRGLMANRWLNVNSVMFPVLVFGLLGHLGFERRNPLAVAAFFLNALLILSGATGALTVSAHLAGVADPSVLDVLRGLSFPLLGGGATVLLLLLHPRLERQGRLLGGRRESLQRPLAAAAAAIGAVVLLVHLPPAASADRLRGVDGVTPVAEALARGEGLFALYPDLWIRMQLRSRRGQVLDFAQLNFLPYVPGAAPAVEKVLNEVYGTSLLGRRGEETGTETLWRRRTLAEWQRIREEFDVTELVLLRPDRLQLPLAFVSETGIVVYSIPAPPGPPRSRGGPGEPPR